MEELCGHLQAEDLAASPATQKILGKLYELILGKYFVKKEVLLESYTKIIELMDNQSPFMKDPELGNWFIKTVYLAQLEKFTYVNLAYKN